MWLFYFVTHLKYCSEGAEALEQTPQKIVDLPWKRH